MKNKRGRTNYTANRMIITDTAFSIYKQLVEKGITVSIGSILSLKPFFVTYATGTFLSLCLCKICLNAKFMFDILMARSKKDGEQSFTSISEFFMYNCDCPKSTNGFYQWSCSVRRCKKCKDSKPPNLSSQISNDLVTVDQFEQVVREYLKLNTKTGLVEKTNSKMTDRVSTQMTYKELYKKLLKL